MRRSPSVGINEEHVLKKNVGLTLKRYAPDAAAMRLRPATREASGQMYRSTTTANMAKPRTLLILRITSQWQ